MPPERRDVQAAVGMHAVSYIIQVVMFELSSEECVPHAMQKHTPTRNCKRKLIMARQVSGRRRNICTHNVMKEYNTEKVAQKYYRCPTRRRSPMELEEERVQRLS